MLPGSRIKTEVLNDTLILTGSVRNPVDSNRAVEIAQRFAVTSDPKTDARAEKKVIKQDKAPMTVHAFVFNEDFDTLEQQRRQQPEEDEQPGGSRLALQGLPEHP